ncbi:MAG: M23 family metallopeptidase [Ruminococcus sp.]|nr:M23 family metallopeptidase [Ruminococcus sp.]
MKSFSLKNTKLGKTLGKKGLYITMGACLLALAGAGVAAYNKTVDSINRSLVITEQSTEPPLAAQIAENKVTDVPKETAATTQKPEEKTEHKEDLNTKTQPNIMPVSGEVICAFSNGELVKSETLGVWKTHDGIDIKAELGAPVKAMNKGKVIKVWSDSLWGNCIKIDHGNGVTGHYYGLTAAAAVSEGDMVNSGDVIGAVGDTAQIEVAQATHLHFALDRNGTWIDPVEYISPSAK